MTGAHIEVFQGWMIETRSASTALNKHKGLQPFFTWLMLDEQDIDRSPMERVKQSTTQKKIIPVICDEDTNKVLGTCKGKDFVQLRDEAIIRLYSNAGARLSEVGTLMLNDIDLDTNSVHYHGKGNKDRRVRFGPKTARAISRYLRTRVKPRGAELPNLWLAGRGGPAPGTQRHQDHAKAAWRSCGTDRCLRPPVAAHRRTRVEASWRGYRHGTTALPQPRPQGPADELPSDHLHRRLHLLPAPPPGPASA